MSDPTLIAAAIAVVGTLSSPILVQYMNSRSKAQEYELQRQQRSEERQFEMDERKQEELRVEYTNLNAKVRDFVKALSDYLHLIRSRKITPDARGPLEDSRKGFLECYAQAQMILPDSVLVAAIEANRHLSRLYGIALRLDGFTTSTQSIEVAISSEHEQDTINSAFDYLEETLRPATWHLRNVMRIDLGIGKAEL
jgi:hypothetical protein